MRGGVKPSSNATFHDRVNALCNSELVWQSEQTKNEFCEPASRVAESPTSLVKNKMLNIVDFIKSLFVKRFSMTYLKKTIAFTLAETLVVMGIIGVVAALTIPNLNQSTGDREKVAKVKKIYSNLNDALGRATAVYGSYEEWFRNDNDDIETMSTRLAQRLQEFMKVSKDCGYGEENISGCFTEDDSLFNGSLGAQLLSSSYYFITADGTSFAMAYNSDDSILILADIDGPNKGKSASGFDVFLFNIDSQGNFNDSPSGNFTSSDGSLSWGDSENQTIWVIRNGNMDYLKLSSNKCPNGESLNWETKTSCK